MRQGITVLSVAVAILITGTSFIPAVQSHAAAPAGIPTDGQPAARCITQHVTRDGSTARQHHIPPAEAAAVRTLLDMLDNALQHADRQPAYAAASELIERGVLPDGGILPLIDRYCTAARHQAPGNAAGNMTNVMSLVAGSGSGIFVYTLDVLATFLIAVVLLPIPFGVVLAMFYMYLWLVVSHAVPFRLVQPSTSFWLFNGSLTSLGLAGKQEIYAAENATVNGSLLGFAGVIVNLIIPREDNASIYYCFVLGTAVAVLPTILPVLSFFTSPARRW